MATKNPPKWHQVYPQGTQAGNEEYKFFVALARHPKFAWRSVSAVAKESGLTEKRTEEILQKYYTKGMVFPSPKNESNWGYWERVPEMLPKDPGSLSIKDQKKRIDKVTGKTSSGSGGGSKQAKNQPTYADDDDDDDTQCKVKPMGGVPAGPVRSFRPSLADMHYDREVACDD
jgi:hypothetical protein